MGTTTAGSDRICGNTLCVTSGTRAENTTDLEVIDEECSFPVSGRYLSVQKYGIAPGGAGYMDVRDAFFKSLSCHI